MSTADRVVRWILDEMLRGELPPGTWLRQDDLAARIGVSKIPVREALQRLAAIGLLRFEQNRGAVIPALSAAEADEIFQLRLAIEEPLLRAAIGRQTIVDLARAELVLTGEALTGEALTHTEANWAFHRALYQPAGWNRGMAMAEALHASVAPYFLLYTETLGAADDSAEEHRKILEACREGRIDDACAELRRHIQGAAGAIGAFLG